MNRRGFFSALLACLGAALTGRSFAVPSLMEEAIDLDWIRAFKLHGDKLWRMEARYRVNGGPWTKKCSRVREPFMWLTPRVGIGFTTQLSEDFRNSNALVSYSGGLL